MGIYADIYDSAAGRDALSVWPAITKVLVMNADGPFLRRPGEPAVKIVRANGGPGMARAVPVNNEGDVIGGTMKGYSFIASSDSRFAECVQRVIGAPFYGAVALHDRREG